MKYLLVLTLVMALSLCAGVLETPTFKSLPIWHGFNIMGNAFNYNSKGSRRYQEEEFQLIHELGFNFVRLPLDYRCWIVDGDWEKIDEDALAFIDEAIEYGKKYDIHICLNFHRAPGFTVAAPQEPRSLWKDPEAQRVCRLHWQTFARRYRDVDPKYLSFNLFNEPNGVSEEDYVKVVKMLEAVIHAENPNRVIIVDGCNWGYNPVKSLFDVPVAQATRGYLPMFITHYKAAWSGGDRFPSPVWPFPNASAWFAGEDFSGGTGKAKETFMFPLQINLSLDKDATFRMKVGRVSQRIVLHAILDGKQIWEHDFTPGPGKGEWEKENYIAGANIYQNYYNMNITLPIPKDAKQLVIKATKGDFCNILEMGIAPQGEKESLLILQSDYASKNVPISFNKSSWDVTYNSQDWHWEKCVKAWHEAKQHTGVFVGEFGCYNKTPHDVVLAWLEDCLKNWKEAGIGWAMWNFSGSFGVLDSDRDDVQYEDFHGHKLDRKMLNLLQKYN